MIINNNENNAWFTYAAFKGFCSPSMSVKCLKSIPSL